MIGENVQDDIEEVSQEEDNQSKWKKVDSLLNSEKKWSKAELMKTDFLQAIDFIRERIMEIALKKASIYLNEASKIVKKKSAILMNDLKDFLENFQKKPIPSKGKKSSLSNQDAPAKKQRKQPIIEEASLNQSTSSTIDELSSQSIQQARHLAEKEQITLPEVESPYREQFAEVAAIDDLDQIPAINSGEKFFEALKSAELKYQSVDRNARFEDNRESDMAGPDIPIMETASEQDVPQDYDGPYAVFDNYRLDFSGMKDSSAKKDPKANRLSERASGSRGTSARKEKYELEELKNQPIPEKMDVLEQQLDECFEQLNKENVYEFKESVRKATGRSVQNQRSERKARQPNVRRWDVDEEIDLNEERFISQRDDTYITEFPERMEKELQAEEVSGAKEKLQANEYMVKIEELLSEENIEKVSEILNNLVSEAEEDQHLQPKRNNNNEMEVQDIANDVHEFFSFGEQGEYDDPSEANQQPDLHQAELPNFENPVQKQEGNKSGSNNLNPTPAPEEQSTRPQSDFNDFNSPVKANASLNREATFGIAQEDPQEMMEVQIEERNEDELSERSSSPEFDSGRKNLKKKNSKKESPMKLSETSEKLLKSILTVSDSDRATSMNNLFSSVKTTTTKVELFYELLILGKMDKISLKQSKPFGAIEIVHNI